MWKGCVIRSEYGANRESRPSARRRAHESAFGVCRFLTPESSATVRDVLERAKVEFDESQKLRKAGKAELVIPDTFEVTYLEKMNVVGAIKRGVLRNYEPARMEQNLKNYNGTLGIATEIPINDFLWVGSNRRKFAGRIGSPEAQAKFQKTAEDLKRLFHEAGAERLPLAEPEHVTVGRYVGPRSNHVRSLDQKRIGSLIGRHFEEAGVESVLLAGLEMGGDEMFEQQMAA